MPPRRTTRQVSTSSKASDVPASIPTRPTRKSSASTTSAPAAATGRVTRGQRRVSEASSLADEDDEDEEQDDEKDSLIDEESGQEEEEEEEEEEPQPKRRGGRSSAPAKPSIPSVKASLPVIKPTATRGRGKKSDPPAALTLNPETTDPSNVRRSARLSISPKEAEASGSQKQPEMLKQKKGGKRKVVESSDEEEEEVEGPEVSASEPEVEQEGEGEDGDGEEEGDVTIQPADKTDTEGDLPQPPPLRRKNTPNGNTQPSSQTPPIASPMKLPFSPSKPTLNPNPSPTKSTIFSSPTKPRFPLGATTSSGSNIPASGSQQSMGVVKNEVKAPAPPKTRLIIHKMVLVDFKSYRGRQEIGPFHKSFSAIVGPNGSGKSNTIDAMLFVFGYRASKMRQGKLSELIHNSKGAEGLDSCSVEVWFEEIMDLPGDKYETVPNSRLVVARTAYRNNSSKYTINDRSSNFSEVTTLLKGRGIDLDHKRFLILQGEVESIAQMKPKGATEHEDGLLEYLEDIIGTSKYKTPIEEAQVQVDELNEARGERLGRLKLVEREKSGLEAKKQEAEDYLRDTNDLTRKKSLLYQFHMHTLNSNIEITQKTMEQLNARLVAEQEKNAGNLAEIESLQTAYNEQVGAFEEVKHHVDVLIKDAKKFEKEEVSLNEKRKHLATKQKKLKKSLTEEGHACSEAKYQIISQGEEVDKIRNNLNELEHRLVKEEADLDEVRDSLKDKTDEFTSKIEALQQKLEPWTAKISEKQSAIDVADSEKKILLGKVTAGEKALADAETALESLTEGVKAKKDQYKELGAEKAEVQQTLTKETKRLESVVKNGETLRSKLTATRQKVDEAKASVAANKSENAVLSTLTKLKNQGRLQGFHGRLGDLGVIDDKYDVAVTTACGALNNLVVDTVEQGQACIEVLRKGNVGRASIMVLDKLPPRDLGPIETPEGVPRLFDLIKPKDAKFAPAFYKGVMNTLVAKDLEQAQRIGYGKKRWRVVTLAGQLIDPSGTMSGGGTRVQSGGMSSKFAAEKVEPEVIAGYEQGAAEAEHSLAQATTDKKALEVEINRLRKRIPDIEMAMEKLELDLNTVDKRIADAKERVKEASLQAKPDAADQKRIKTLEAEIAGNTKEADKLRQSASGIESQIKELQEKILEVGGVKLRALQSTVANTRGLIDLGGDNLTKAEVAQAKAERDAEKLSKSIAANTAKLEEMDGELATIEGEWKACSNDLETIRSKVEEAQNSLEAVQDTLTEAKNELEEKSSSINAFRALEMEITQKVEDQGRVHKECRGKLKHWQKRHDELELVHIDEEDEEEEEQAENQEAAKQEEDAEAHETEEGEVEQPKKRKRRAESDELVEFSEDELQEVNVQYLNAEITQLEEELGRVKPNLNVLAEYRKREAEFLDRAKDLETITSERDQAKKRYDDLRKTRLEEFMVGFSAISSKLKEMYQMITLGGNAELELVDSMDPFSEGIIFSVMPPKKSWKNISNLSGGEKTLSSLALVFALHVFKPTPLYFMDEIDAALDFRNVSIIANYIKSKTEAAQFIIISLRNDMFELSHRLVGIYKTSNCTKSVAIDNKDIRLQALPVKAAPVGSQPV